MVKDILKLKYVLSGNKKFVANYNKHDWTLHTIHTRNSEWKGSFMNEMSSKLYNLFRTGQVLKLLTFINYNYYFYL